MVTVIRVGHTQDIPEGGDSLNLRILRVPQLPPPLEHPQLKNPTGPLLDSNIFFLPHQKHGQKRGGKVLQIHRYLNIYIYIYIYFFNYKFVFVVKINKYI